MRFFVLLLLLFARSALAEPKFEPVLGPISLNTPHGAHRQFGTEWWYFTGHLHGEKTFGFELTFFRIGVRREEALTNAAHNPSGWDAQSIYLAHFALTDEHHREFLFSEHRGRESFGEAGASNTDLRVWIRDWIVAEKDGVISLKAQDAEKSLELKLHSRKPMVAHGERGFSRKGPLPGEASIYTSLTRLEGDGNLTVKGTTQKFTRASVWMDHEAFTTTEQKGAKAWEWFAIQLSNGEEIMLYQLRDADGKVSPFSSGTLVKSDGSFSTIEEFSVQALSSWTSPKTGRTYPQRWKLTLPGYDLELTPVIPNQEIGPENATGVPYWEGRAVVSGSHKGEAYVELVQ